jgi:hypothetical protein
MVRFSCLVRRAARVGGAEAAGSLDGRRLNT